MSVRQIGKYKMPTQSQLRRVKNTLPLIVGNTAKNHFTEGFRLGGRRTDKSRSGWKRRKRQDSGRAILVGKGTGTLRKDIQVRRKRFDYIVVGTGEDTKNYAYVHNEGIGNMPQREFLGHSTVLTKKTMIIVNREIMKYFK